MIRYLITYIILVIAFMIQAICNEYVGAVITLIEIIALTGYSLVKMKK